MSDSSMFRELSKIEKRRDEATALLKRASDLATRAAAMSDSSLSVVFDQGASRTTLGADIEGLRADLILFDQQMLAEEKIYSRIDAHSTAAELTVVSVIRTTIGRYLDSASRDLNDATLRAFTRATLWVSIFVLLTSFVTVWVTVHPPK